MNLDIPMLEDHYDLIYRNEPSDFPEIPVLRFHANLVFALVQFLFVMSDEKKEELREYIHVRSYNSVIFCYCIGTLMEEICDPGVENYEEICNIFKTRITENLLEKFNIDISPYTHFIHW